MNQIDKDTGDWGNWRKISDDDFFPEEEKDTSNNMEEHHDEDEAIIREMTQEKRKKEDKDVKIRIERGKSTGKDSDWFNDVFLLPVGIYAHFLLIDISYQVKEIRRMPMYLPIKKTRILIGGHFKAHIHLDDSSTIDPKHAKIIYKETDGKNEFVLYPISNAPVIANDNNVSDEGIVVQNGDLIKIGSAKLIFFQKDIGRNER